MRAVRRRAAATLDGRYQPDTAYRSWLSTLWGGRESNTARIVPKRSPIVQQGRALTVDGLDKEAGKLSAARSEIGKARQVFRSGTRS